MGESAGMKLAIWSLAGRMVGRVHTPGRAQPFRRAAAVAKVHTLPELAPPLLVSRWFSWDAASAPSLLPAFVPPSCLPSTQGHDAGEHSGSAHASLHPGRLGESRVIIDYPSRDFFVSLCANRIRPLQSS